MSVTDLGATVHWQSITAGELLEEKALPFVLELVAGRGGLARPIGHTRIQKPGLALVGHFDGVSSERVQILGQTEVSFLRGMAAGRRAEACDAFCARGFCAVVVTSTLGAPDELRASADEHGVAVMQSPVKSSTTINALHGVLDERLAPRTRVHGVMVDVYGVGILLLGKSSVGKSECALELVQRGHRLVADDLVECVWRPPGVVHASAPALLRNHLEVRGLGILNIKDLFGVASVRERKRVQMVVRLVGYDVEEPWDRLGLDDEVYELLSVGIPLRRVPVRPGKNTAASVEVAARNELLRQEGHHSARDFHERLAAALGVDAPGKEPGEPEGSSR